MPSGVTHSRDTVAIHLIVKSGERSTPCGCPLHSLGSRGVAPTTRGSGIASDPAIPARVSHSLPDWYVRHPDGVAEGSARRPTRGRGDREVSLYIGHRFADDRCLWSEHPSGVHHRMDAGKSSSGGTPVGVHCRKARRGLCRTSRMIDGWRHPCASDRVSSLGRAVVEEEPEEDPGDERIAGEDKPALREADPINHKARRIGTDRGAEPIRHHQEDALSR